MIKIYVCEDDDEQREKVKTIVENIVLMEDVDMELSCVTDDPYTVIEKVKSTEEVGLYFLDIDLKKDINGLELAKELRLYDPRGFVVFITTHSEMSYFTFMGKRIFECIKEADRRFSSEHNKVHSVFSIKIGEKVYSVDYDDVLFFETSSNVHKIIVHCKKRQMEFLGKIKDIEDSVDDRFYRCHRSFLVNKDNIKEIDFKNRMIYMVNGEECMLSNRMMKGLK